VIDTTTAPKPAMPGFLEGPRDGEYGWNACRVPWRLATHYIVSHDARPKNAAQKRNARIKAHANSGPGPDLARHKPDGSPGTQQSGPSPAFSSPFAVAAMLGTDQQWLDKIWTTRSMGGGYYGDSITMLSMVVMSGNWWQP